jgi:hypothetical protein
MTHIESMDENAVVTLLARRARFDSTLAAFRGFTTMHHKAHIFRTGSCIKTLSDAHTP